MTSFNLNFFCEGSVSKCNQSEFRASTQAFWQRPSTIQSDHYSHSHNSVSQSLLLLALAMPALFWDSSSLQAFPYLYLLPLLLLKNALCL